TNPTALCEIELRSMNTIAGQPTKNYTPAQARAVQLMEQNQVQDALDLLQHSTGDVDSPVSHQLMGAAALRLQRFDLAQSELQKALDQDPNNADVKDMLAQANDNSTTDAQVEIVHNPYSKDKLLAPPDPGPGLDGPAQPGGIYADRKGKLGFMTQLVVHNAGRLAGHVAGCIAGGVVGLLARTFGAKKQGEVWTTWSKQNMIEGMMMLDHMRNELDAHNLHDSYQDGGHLSGFVAPGAKPPEGVEYYRTADGSWNDLANPKEGAAGVRFGRNSAFSASFPDTRNLMTPNPREISRALLTRDKFKEVPFLNMFAAAWIQFMVHDWINHGDNDYANGTWNIPLAPDDPIRQQYHMNALPVPKTPADPTARPDEKGLPPSFINENTAWWDGSQLYGSNLETQNRLRSHVDGKLKLTADGRLPLAKDGVEDTGFRRNWWLGLDLFHNLFAEEHNSVCDMLKSHHPDWNDERLFQTARLIVAAEIAKIHTVEWTPAILPNKMLTVGMNANWSGLANYVIKNVDGRPVVEHWKPTDPVVGGIVGNKIDKHGVPYSLTEEFTSVYRLHSLLPDVLKLYRIGQNGVEDVPLAKTRQKGVHQITDTHSMDDLLYSFGIDQPGQLVLNNYPKALQEMVIPGFSTYDLGAVDILRDRERGVPRYNEFRRQLGLKPIRSFEDLTDDAVAREKLRKLYNNDVEQIDLMVGTLAETHRPENFGFGETMFQVFILNASRRLQADRFFTTDYNEKTYTREGLEWIDRSNLKNILLRQHPELAQTGLSNINNAFEPWDTGKLDPSRHPLEQYHR
ncbi:MAG: peroxidase family protein, partial [Candidatus Xenobia bacterium]